jgi:hypothetical protein
MASATRTAPDAGEIRKKWGRKRANSSEEAGHTSVKKQGWSKKSVGSVAARNNFAPQRMVEVD